MKIQTVERASQVSNGDNKKSEETGAEADSLDGFTKRMLLSLVFDVSQLAENVERVKVVVFTAAKAHGIVPPTAPQD